jgi:hypothetical protein
MTYSLAYIRENHDTIDWYQLIRKQELSEDILREFRDKFDWNDISLCTLSENFIREFHDQLNWKTISRYQKISESFIREFKDKIELAELSLNSNINLSESFIEEQLKKFQTAQTAQTLPSRDLYIFILNICYVGKMTPNLIEKYPDIINWNNVSLTTTLSEDFIRKYQDRVHWVNISYGQKLSEEFIWEFREQLLLTHQIYSNIKHFQNLSDEFREKIEKYYKENAVDDGLCYNFWYSKISM